MIPLKDQHMALSENRRSQFLMPIGTIFPTQMAVWRYPVSPISRHSHLDKHGDFTTTSWTELQQVGFKW